MGDWRLCRRCSNLASCLSHSTETQAKPLWGPRRTATSTSSIICFDTRCDPSALGNRTFHEAAKNGQLVVVERLLQDKRVDPSANCNDAMRWAAGNGHLAVVERLLQDERVDPSGDNNHAVRWAAWNGQFAVVKRLLEDDRVDVAVAIRFSRPENRKRFECRERLTEICIALQDLELPAWVTVQILDAARPWSTLPLHSKWNLVCAVKHYHDKKQ
jgi:hypothetical protein